MDASHQNRAVVTALGALAALALYGWIEIAANDWLAGRALFAGVMSSGVFFAALLAIFPRIPALQAVVYAAGLTGFVTALMLLASNRYTGIAGLAEAVFPVFAAFTICALPLPFFIAASKGHWRDYSVLFDESWNIVLRFAMAGVLIGTVWLLIFLSDVLLSLVGLGFLDWLLGMNPAPFLITGAAGGFGIAVAAEGLGPRGSSLALMLLRPLLPAIAGVVALFLLALPFRGLSNLFGTLSAGMTLMAMTAVAATLVTAVVDADDMAASRSKVLSLSARGMGLCMALLGALSVIAVAQRVGQYGWTPTRVYAALGAAVSFGYGAIYAAQMVRPKWMAGVRRANVTMSLALIGLAVLALTPLLHPERMAANSQMARFLAGKVDVGALDVTALQSWGLAGQGAVDALTALSKNAGQEKLAVRLANPYDAFVQEPQNDLDYDLDLRRDGLAAVIPTQPLGALEARALINGLTDGAVEETAAACARPSGPLAKSCVLIIADFLPDAPGREAVAITLDAQGYLQVFGMAANAQNGSWAQTHVLPSALPEGASAIALMQRLQSAPPALQPAPINILPLGTSGVLVLP